MICESRLLQITQTGKIYYIYKWNYSEKTAYRTEPEIGNRTHKTTGENELQPRMSKGAKKVGLYYFESLRHLQGPHKKL